MSESTQEANNNAGSSSASSVDDIEIRPHQSKASQNLSDNMSETGDQELLTHLNVHRTTSDTLLNTETGDSDLKDSVSLVHQHPEQDKAARGVILNRDPVRPRSSASFPQMDNVNEDTSFDRLISRPDQRDSIVWSDDTDHTDDLEISKDLFYPEQFTGDTTRADSDVFPRPAAGLQSPPPASLASGQESSISPASHARCRSPHSQRGLMMHEYRNFTGVGAGMSSPRRESPSPDQVASTTGSSSRRSSRGPFTEQRAFMIEKELLDSQLRKLQIDNTTLAAENKLVKEKYNRAQSRIQQLESQLSNIQQESSHMQEELNQEVINVRRQTREGEQRDRVELEEKVLTFTRETEALKKEVMDLERKLKAEKLNSELTLKASDQTLIVESYKAQIDVLHEELKRTKNVLDDAEKARSQEVLRRQEASAQIVRLTELKATLQQELENMGGGTVAEKQVKSLECRLKITEDRLHQERADRAGKLSEVEEKLLNENARLQISEKELGRQVQRDLDKFRNLDQRYRSSRDEVERLRLQLPDKPALLDSNKLRATLGNTKHTEEIKFVMEQMKRDENLGQGQESDIILLLWQQREESFKQLKDLEFAVTESNIQPSNAKDCLKKLREEHSEYADSSQQHKNQYEDVVKNKEEQEEISRRQINDLVKDKHNLQAKVRNLQDMSDAVKAENSSLHVSLRTSAGLPPANKGKDNTWEAQAVNLQYELEKTQGYLEHQKRQVRLMQSELDSAQGQLRAKERGLHDAMQEKRYHSRMTAPPSPASWQDDKSAQLNNLSTEVNSEKVAHQHVREELSSVTRQLEAAHHENDVMATGLEAERATVRQLKEECQKVENKHYDKDNRTKSLLLEVESLKSQLSDSKRLNDQAKRDKKTLYEDVQDLCRKLAEKDEALSRLKAHNDMNVTEVQKELSSYRTEYSRDKQTLETNLTQAKEEVELLNQRLQEKDTQLQTYYRSNRDLEELSRSRQEYEVQSTRLDQELQDNKRYLSTVQVENARLNDQNRQTQDSLDKLRETHVLLKEQIRQQVDDHTREKNEARHLLSLEKRRHDTERSHLQDDLNKSIAELKSCQASLSAAVETRDSLHSNKYNMNQTVETLRDQLQNEKSNRRVAEQQSLSMQTQLDELRCNKISYDEKSSDQQNQLTRLQTELKMIKENYSTITQDLNDAQTAAETHENHARNLCTQVTQLQVELTKTNNELKITQQDLSDKNKRLSLEVSQLSGNLENQKLALGDQTQQMSLDLDKARRDLNERNREILNLKEQILTLEEQLRDSRDCMKRERDATNAERAIREKLDSRNMELELLVTRMRSRDDGDDKFDATRQEVSRKIAELSRRVAEQLERQRGQQVDVSEIRQLEEHKKRFLWKISALESSLHQEQSLHIVTKTQLTALGEDNKKLRQQLQAARRRSSTSTETTDRSKSRMEEINEIILRSQMRAQQLSASTGLIATADPSRALHAHSPDSHNNSGPLVFNTTLNSTLGSEVSRSHAGEDVNLILNNSS